MTEIPASARRRLTAERVGWLTTVTDSGTPAPNPIWFVPEGNGVVVFTSPGSRKVHNVQARPRATFHLNSDADGGDIVILVGDVEVRHRQQPSAFPGYLDRYGDAITGALGMTVAQADATFDTQLRLRPTRVRLTPG